MERRTIRFIVLAAIGLWAAGWVVFLIVSPAPAGAIIGWNLSDDGTPAISYVTPGGAAARAAIAAGDTLDWKHLSVFGRANLGVGLAAPLDSELRATLIHGGKARAVTLRARQFDPSVQYAFIGEILTGAILVAAGIMLVRLRPCKMTWGFALAFLTFGAGTSSTFQAQSSSSMFIIENCGWALLNGVSIAGMLVFLSRFPNDEPRFPLTIIERIAVPLGAAAALFGAATALWNLYADYPVPHWVAVLNQYAINWAFTILALIALAAAFLRSKGSDRNRVAPVMFAFVIYVASWLLINSPVVTNAAVVTMVDAISLVAMLILAAAVVYGVVRHRVIDISFVLSRTLVYTILGTVIIGVFTLIDFASGKLLEKLGFTIAFEACAAFIFALTFHRLHARVDHLVDNMLFRARHLAERRLECALDVIARLETSEEIDEVLVDEASEALMLASAAVFRRDDAGDFIRVRGRGWSATDVKQLPKGHVIISKLLAEKKALELSESERAIEGLPQALMQPLFAIPLSAHREITGVVLYGGHLGGEGIDPDERHMLQRVASAAASADEYVRTVSLIAEAEALRLENAHLRKQGEALR